MRQRILNEELNHRVKNILALIKTVVTQSSDGSPANQSYSSKILGRIQALAIAHDQIASGKGSRQLSRLVHTELQPYQGGRGRIIIRGDPVMLDERAFATMALVVHEMATNAAKYGALSHAEGVLDVSWRLLEDGSCEALWTESGGPGTKSDEPARTGFGSVLIHRSVPFDLGGTAEVRLTPSGMMARFVLPAHHVTPANEVQDEESLAKPQRVPVPARTLKGVHVLSLEDQLVISLDVEDMLVRSGAKVTTASSAAEAMSRIARSAPEVAVLDVNLGSGTSSQVAAELARRKIPFLFATGYGDTARLPKAFHQVPILRKPLDGERLVSALARLLETRD